MILALASVISLCSVLLLGGGLHFLLANRMDPNYCHMTYMYQNPVYTSIQVKNGPANNDRRYRLLQYTEGIIRGNECKGRHPVLYISGNSGSYKQVRSIASIAADMDRTNYLIKGSPRRPLSFFTVDFNEELSALFGGVLPVQSEYAAHCVRHLQSMCTKPSGTGKLATVTILGHSMGGLVALSLLNSDVLQAGSIETIVTVATPHRPVLAFDYRLGSFYHTMNSAVLRSATQNVTLVSIETGIRDFQVRADLASLGMTGPNIVHASTSGIPGAWLSCDHLAAVWCKQLVLPILTAMSVLSLPSPKAADAVGNFQSTSDIARANERAERYRSTLLPAAEFIHTTTCDSADSTTSTIGTTDEKMWPSPAQTLQDRTGVARTIKIALGGSPETTSSTETLAISTTETISSLSLCSVRQCYACGNGSCVSNADELELRLETQRLPYWRDTFKGANVRPPQHFDNLRRPVTAVLIHRMNHLRSPQSWEDIHLEMVLNAAGSEQAKAPVYSSEKGFVSIGWSSGVSNVFATPFYGQTLAIESSDQHHRVRVAQPLESCLITSILRFKLMHSETGEDCPTNSAGYIATHVSNRRATTAQHYSANTHTRGGVQFEHVLRPCDATFDKIQSYVAMDIDVWDTRYQLDDMCRLKVALTFSPTNAATEYVRLYGPDTITRAVTILLLIIATQIFSYVPRQYRAPTTRTMHSRRSCFTILIIVMWLIGSGIKAPYSALDNVLVNLCSLGVALAVYKLVAVVLWVGGWCVSRLSPCLSPRSKQSPAPDVGNKARLPENPSDAFYFELDSKFVAFGVGLCAVAILVTGCSGIGVAIAAVISVVQSIRERADIQCEATAQNNRAKDNSWIDSQRIAQSTGSVVLCLLSAGLYGAECVVYALGHSNSVESPPLRLLSPDVVDLTPAVLVIFSLLCGHIRRPRLSPPQSSRLSKGLSSVAVVISLAVDRDNFWLTRYSLALALAALALN